jgi:hypothetical protein
MAGPLDRFLKVITPKRQKAKGVSSTNTYAADRTEQVLSAPTYKEHLNDLFSERQSDDSKDLLQKLFVHDPDVSAALSAFLTVADTEPVFTVKDADGAFDRKGMQALNQILATLTERFDYSKGFQLQPNLQTLTENMRYMVLLRGGIGEELVFDKMGVPVEIRHVDLATLEWFEVESNKFVPSQLAPQSNVRIDLNIPTFFVSHFRRDPTKIYANSPFVSSINTVAARQQVINDLYRIMQVTGFPRMDVTIMEEVLKKNANSETQQDATKMRAFIDGEVARIQAAVASLRADQALVHTDSVDFKIANEKNPATGLDISSVISALNAMNQAGLRSMATILGRGESGVNTASVEARIFSMNAEALNVPVAECLSQILTMALRVVTKTDARVECKFRGVELRPELELEPMRVMKASRLRQDLSDGIISDDEYHLEMYGRIRPDTAPELSGTDFMSSGGVEMDEKDVSPNSDPLGRGLAPKGSKAARSSNVTKKAAKDS